MKVLLSLTKCLLHHFQFFVRPACSFSFFSGSSFLSVAIPGEWTPPISLLAGAQLVPFFLVINMTRASHVNTAILLASQRCLSNAVLPCLLRAFFVVVLSDYVLV